MGRESRRGRAAQMENSREKTRQGKEVPSFSASSLSSPLDTSSPCLELLPRGPSHALAQRNRALEQSWCPPPPPSLCHPAGGSKENPIPAQTVTVFILSWDSELPPESLPESLPQRGCFRTHLCKVFPPTSAFRPGSLSPWTVLTPAVLPPLIPPQPPGALAYPV